jgi:hypothetical protein
MILTTSAPATIAAEDRMRTPSTKVVELPTGDTEVGVVYTEQGRCWHCAHLMPPIEGAVNIQSIEKKGDGFVASGYIPFDRCPFCGMMIHAISEVVPVELAGLSCSCGGKQFRFAIKTIKPNKAKNPTEWKFDLDVICTICSKRKFRQKILNLFRLKRIKVGATGVDLQLK